MGILTEEMQRVVDAELGFIATVCPDGTPNLSPKGTTAVWDDGHLVFADICSPGTVANLLQNSSIEINVVDQLVRKGYRFKGTGEVYTDGDVFERGVQFYEARGTVKARERIHGIVIVTVERALPLISPAYDLGLTVKELAEQNLDRLQRHGAEITGREHHVDSPS
jgi:predicted pyridoxine 5'-phosphate oxidase superfamily flavin-nucleotide-binding protein